MRVLTVTAVAVSTISGVAAGASSTSAATRTAAASATSGKPWFAAGLTVDQRVNLLLANMTLDEKIAELHADKCPPYESCIPANTRLGLPELVLEDDSTGVAAGMHGVTALPATIGASASWDPSLIKSYGQVIGREEHAKGVDVTLAPTVNIGRVPQWGRNFESLGEDPYLSSQMGVADTQGIQSQGIVADVKHLAAYNQETNRHTISAQVDSRTLHEIYLPAFAAQVRAGAGSMMSSYNAINGVPDSQNPYLLTTVLRDQLGFKGFVRSDGGGTYSTVPAANAGLDIQVKGKTDYFAAPLKQAVEDGQVSMARINSMVRPILRDMFVYHLVGHTWGNGTKTQNVITAQDTQTALNAAEQGTVLLKNDGGQLPLPARQLTSIAVVGPGAMPGYAEGGGSGNVIPPFLVSPVQGIQAASPRARVSTAPGVADPSTLPAIPSADLNPPYHAGSSYSGTLTPTVSGRYTLAVHDPRGYNPMTLSVNGTPVLSAAGTVDDQYGVGSVDLQAGQHYQVQISGASDKLLWADPAARAAAIGQAVSMAKKSQVAVVVAGYHESEAVDRANFALSGGQNQLIQAVAAANPHTIVVLNTGGPVLMPWLSQVPSVLESWYPGEEDGTALAAVLSGAVDPSGKLPVTFPAAANQVPASTPQQFPGVNGVADYSEGLQVGYRWYDAQRKTPLFPFGYGLSYTHFAFSNLAISPGSMTSLGTAQVSATVTNTGTRAGSEVAQLYVGDPAASGEPPRQLKGFRKVTLNPGQSTRVTFPVTPHDLSQWDSADHTWTAGDGVYQIMVGDSSANLPLTGSLRVSASTGTRAVSIHAPAAIRTGQPVTVTATLSAGGDLPLRGVGLRLAAPESWHVTPLSSTEAAALQPDQAMTTSWRVTAPASAQDDIRSLAATARYTDGAGASGSKTARTQVTTQPLVTTSVQPQTLVTAAGHSAVVILSNTDTSGYPVKVSWNAAPPAGSGITVSPSSGSATIAPGASDSQQLSVGSPAPGSAVVPIQVQASAASPTLAVPGAYLNVHVAYPSTAAAYDNVGITSSSDPSAGNFSGSGISYSADALAQVGLTPGARVTADSTTFTWPDVPPGEADNVVASGQAIAMTGTGSHLGFLGASAYGNATGTGMITYTDGTTQPFTLTMSDYYGTTPAAGDKLVAVAPYRNSARGVSNHTASVYATSIALQPGKTVQYVTLPDVSPGVTKGHTSMHIFDIALGS